MSTYYPPVVHFHDPIQSTTNSFWLSRNDIEIARRITRNFIPPLFQKMVRDPRRPSVFYTANGTTITVVKQAYNALESRRGRPEWGIDITVRGNAIRGAMVGSTVRALRWIVGNSAPDAAVYMPTKGVGLYVLLPTRMDCPAALAEMVRLGKECDWQAIAREAAEADQEERARVMASVKNSPTTKLKGEQLGLV